MHTVILTSIVGGLRTQTRAGRSCVCCLPPLSVQLLPLARVLLECCVLLLWDALVPNAVCGDLRCRYHDGIRWRASRLGSYDCPTHETIARGHDGLDFDTPPLAGAAWCVAGSGGQGVGGAFSFEDGLPSTYVPVCTTRVHCGKFVCCSRDGYPLTTAKAVTAHTMQGGGVGPHHACARALLSWSGTDDRRWANMFSPRVV